MSEHENGAGAPGVLRTDDEAETLILRLGRHLRAPSLQSNELDGLDMRAEAAGLARVGARHERDIERWKRLTDEPIDHLEVVILSTRPESLRDAAVKLMVTLARLDLIHIERTPEERERAREHCTLAIVSAVERIQMEITPWLDLGPYGYEHYLRPLGEPYYRGQQYELTC